MAKPKTFLPEIKTKQNQNQNVEDIEITNGKFKIYLTEKYASIQLLGDILVGFFFVFGSLMNIFGAPEVIGNSSYLIGSLSLTVRPILKIIRRTWIYNEQKEQEEKLSSQEKSDPGTADYDRVKKQAIHINGEFSEDVDEAFTDRSELIDDGGMEVTKSGAHIENTAVGKKDSQPLDRERTIDEKTDDSSMKSAGDHDAQIQSESSVESSDEHKEAEQTSSPSEGEVQDEEESSDENSDRGFYHHDSSEDNESNEDQQPLSFDADKRKDDS